MQRGKNLKYYVCTSSQWPDDVTERAVDTHPKKHSTQAEVFITCG